MTIMEEENVVSGATRGTDFSLIAAFYMESHTQITGKRAYSVNIRDQHSQSSLTTFTGLSKKST